MDRVAEPAATTRRVDRTRRIGPDLLAARIRVQATGRLAEAEHPLDVETVAAALVVGERGVGEMADREHGLGARQRCRPRLDSRDGSAASGGSTRASSRARAALGTLTRSRRLAGPARAPPSSSRRSRIESDLGSEALLAPAALGERRKQPLEGAVARRAFGLEALLSLECPGEDQSLHRPRGADPDQTRPSSAASAFASSASSCSSQTPNDFDAGSTRRSP